MVDEDIAAAAAAAVDADEVLAFARALIAAPSENPGGTEDEAAAVATDILKGIGASPETIRGEEQRPSVVASIGSGGTPVPRRGTAILDVVPVGDPANWRHDPGPVRSRTAG
jgi:acetylornithine deacetylase